MAQPLEGDSTTQNIPGVKGTNTAASGVGVDGSSPIANGVHGQNGSGANHPPQDASGKRLGAGVWGETDFGLGLYGASIGNSGVYGKSIQAVAVFGEGGTFGALGTGSFAGVSGESQHIGVQGRSRTFVAVYGFSGDPVGVNSGPEGLTPGVAQVGVYGRGSPLTSGGSGGPIGVFGITDANGGQAVSGLATSNTSGYGVVGSSTQGHGVHGVSDQTKPNGYAGYFGGKVHVTGNLEKAGGGFKIDHPLDPSNRYLLHSFVESSEMKNVYDGSVTLDGMGEATVALPRWFEALNSDYRYQLTAIGTPAPNLHVAEVISKDGFKIAGGKPRMQVCWQVTGVRKDQWATAHPLSVEVNKPKQERGFYLHPELYKQPEEKGIEWARNPGQAKVLQEMRKIGVRTKVGKRKGAQAA